jgi:hypothetical protein
VKLGNCNNNQILSALLGSQGEIRETLGQAEVGLVEVYQPVVESGTTFLSQIKPV